DEPHELPRRLLVRAVLVNQVSPGEQGARTGAGLLTRQCVHLEVHIGRVLLEPAEKPRLAEDDGGPFLAEGIFGIAERQAGDLFHIRTQQTGAPRVREGEKLVRDPHWMTLAADGEAHLRWLTTLGVGNR